MENEYKVFSGWIKKTENAQLLKKQNIDELAQRWQKQGGSISVFMHCLKDKVPNDIEVIEAIDWLYDDRNKKLLDSYQFDQLYRRWIDEKGTNLNAIKAVLTEAGIDFE